MNISEHLKKDYWTRRVTPDNARMYPPVGNSVGYRLPKTGYNGVGYVNLTQDQFLNEINSSAHIINSRFMSQRPIFKQTDEIDPKTGKKKVVLDGFDDIETVALAIQEFIVGKKISHLTGDNFWVASEDKDEEAFQKVESWMDYAGFWDAWAEAVSYCERECDSALYWWFDGSNLNYEVFAYEKGDSLYPNVDEDGRPALYRAYTLNGKPAVDIFTVEAKETWVKVDTEEDAGKVWLNRIFRFLKGGSYKQEISEDGYTLISRKQSQVGNDLLQIVYFRVPDIATGPVQDCIEKYEKAHSYIAEEVKNDAFPILFLKSEKIVSLPPSKINGKTIGVKGTADTLAHSDAKFLAPPDASNTAKINLDTLWSNILRGSLTSLVEPVDIRQGADSSTTIKIMFAPDIEWCKNRWKFYAKPVRQLVEVFKRLVGKAEGDIARYGDLKISSGQNIWIPQNESERIKIELDQYYAGVKSRKATMSDIGNSHLGDAEQIMKEQEAEKALEAKYKVASEESNPNIPNVTNQAKNQPKGK